MLTRKAVTISTPFLFKMLVGVVGGRDVGRDLDTANLAPILADSPASLPVLLLLAYGLVLSHLLA